MLGLVPLGGRRREREREDLRFIDEVVARSREAVFVRRVDHLLLIRPDKTMGLNDSALRILEALYAPDAGPAREVLSALARELRVRRSRLVEDARGLIDNLLGLLKGDYSPRDGLAFGPFDRSLIRYPTIAEIALTWLCNNRCTFCYAAAPYRHAGRPVMSTEQVKAVMWKIRHQGHVPSLSFTGGEATLRKDLPELIAHGKELGFRVNLISNGLRAGKADFAAKLADAGLDAAQISLEAADPALHDRVVDRRGAWKLTTAAVRNFAALGLHVHTNSTLCADNLEHAEDLVRFVARDLGRPVMSMNMLIRTGSALQDPRMEVAYSDIAARLPRLLEVANEEGIRLVWYSPVPYCVINPVLHGLGAKSCACVDGILSVDPTGQVLPCSSFEEGIGSLLEQDFEAIYGSPAARYWKEKEYLPPGCRSCGDKELCGGACPLYWDEAGSFAELPGRIHQDPEARACWEASRAAGASYGVRAPGEV